MRSRRHGSGPSPCLCSREDKHAPLSDQALAERLQAQGIDISRRTVAKYRQLLQIPSAATRRA
ncbi:MAG: hypothetical protein ACLS3C_10830 [Oscillospiraceae bacterium]